MRSLRASFWGGRNDRSEGFWRVMLFPALYFSVILPLSCFSIRWLKCSNSKANYWKTYSSHSPSAAWKYLNTLLKFVVIQFQNAWWERAYCKLLMLYLETFKNMSPSDEYIVLSVTTLLLPESMNQSRMVRSLFFCD